MIFIEKKIVDESTQQEKFEYTLHEVFGKVEMKSDSKLSPDLLDGVVGVLLAQNISAERLEGEVKHTNGVVKYVFNKRPMWEKDDTLEIDLGEFSKRDEPCTNSHISTQKPVNGFTPILKFGFQISNWLRKFVEGFHDLCKKVKKLSKKTSRKFKNKKK